MITKFDMKINKIKCRGMKIKKYSNTTDNIQKNKNKIYRKIKKTKYYRKKLKEKIK